MPSCHECGEEFTSERGPELLEEVVQHYVEEHSL